MKTRLPQCLIVAVLVGPWFISRAALVETWSGSQAIPDNNPVGVAFNFTLSDPTTSITDVSVKLNISGGNNGDLYGYLAHDSGFSVLLNRVGRTAGSPFGYSTPGMDITLTSSALPDVHNYQGLATFNGSGQLTGSWSADGRNTDPAVTLDTSPRSALLSSFNGLNPNGSWTLFLSDLSPVGLSTINGWSVEVTAVPEPEHYMATFGVFAAGVVLLRQPRIKAWLQRRF